MLCAVGSATRHVVFVVEMGTVGRVAAVEAAVIVAVMDPKPVTLVMGLVGLFAVAAMVWARSTMIAATVAAREPSRMKKLKMIQMPRLIAHRAEGMGAD